MTTTKTEYEEKLLNIKENAKYLKLAYSFHNAKEMLEEHNNLNTNLTDFYNELLQKETDIRYENGKENRVRHANFPYKKYLMDLERKSTIITTNLSFEKWEDIFKNPVMTTAIIDRITHKAMVINMNGNSYRLRETQEWMEKNIK